MSEDRDTPMAQIGWADEFGNLFPMAAWKPAQRTHHDSHKTAWRPVFLHPPAAEVQRLIAAARAVVSTWYTASSESAVDTFEVMRAALDALEGRVMRRIEKRGVVNVLCDDYGCSPATKAEAEFFDEITRLRAEVESLRHTKEAFDEWLAKTDWVQKSAAVNELGKHRADVLRDRIEALRAALKPFAAIDLTTNQAVDAMDVLRARRALEGK